jgi:hypothetical protein
VGSRKKAKIEKRKQVTDGLEGGRMVRVGVGWILVGNNGV